MAHDDPKDKKQPAEQRRQHYRIPYPIVERPRLAFGGRKHNVIDLSEKGIKFQLGKDDFCLLADPAIASIRQDGKEIAALGGSILLLENQMIHFVPKERALYAVIRQVSAQKAGLLTVELFGISPSSAQFKPDRIEFPRAANRLLEQMPPLAAQVFLNSQTSYAVHGRIIRVEDRRTIIYLSDEIPFKAIVDEQLRLRKRYLAFN